MWVFIPINILGALSKWCSENLHAGHMQGKNLIHRPESLTPLLKFFVFPVNVLFNFFLGGATPNSSRGLFLALCSENTPDWFRGPHGVPHVLNLFQPNATQAPYLLNHLSSLIPSNF